MGKDKDKHLKLVVRRHNYNRLNAVTLLRAGTDLRHSVNIFLIRTPRRVAILDVGNYPQQRAMGEALKTRTNSDFH